MNRKLIFLLTLALISCASLLATAEDAWNLALLSEVRGDPYRIVRRDLIDRDRTSPELIEQYGEISIPRTGGDGSIQPSHILLAFSRAGAQLSKIRLLTYSAVQFQGADQSDVISLVQDAILQSVKGRYQGDSSQIEIELTRIPANLPDRRAFMSVEAQLKDDGSTSGVRNFTVKFIGQDKSTVAVAEFEGRVSLKISVVAAKRPILKGEYVTKEDFEEIKKDLNQSEGFVLSLSELGDARWQMNQGMDHGAILSRSTVDFASNIKKGAVVTLLTGDKRFQVRTMGRVLEVLDNGANVLVENIDSKKTLLGQPVNASEVRVAY